MDPFVQHFNNIFRCSPLQQSHEQCLDVLRSLLHCLCVPYLASFDFGDAEQRVPFDAGAFKGVRALDNALLSKYYAFLQQDVPHLSRGRAQRLRNTLYVL